MFAELAFHHLKPRQSSLVRLPLQSKIFLEGPAGAGKTTAGVHRLLHLMAEGIPASSILLLTPQRTLAAPYLQALEDPGVVGGGVVASLTLGGLAQRMVDLFWPLASAAAGFRQPERPPIFLTLETAQYYMAHLVEPLLKEGFFDSVKIDRNRLFSQVLDNLNKAALVGFPVDEIGPRLKEVWIGEPGQLRVYEDVQECASLFRRFCLDHNLLDYSLQVELFRSQLWPAGICRSYLAQTYRHLIFDNLEEDTPFTQDILSEWLPEFESALFIYDWRGGFRRFLGADPQTALEIAGHCQERVVFDAGLVMSEPVQALAAGLEALLQKKDPQAEPGAGRPRLMVKPKLRQALAYQQHIYYPEMLDWVADQVAGLVHQEGFPPSEIVVLAPYLSDSLRFSLLNRLDARGVPARSHRPSRALREEPATRCLLTLAGLAYPEWQISVNKTDVAYALMQAIAGLDLVRAQLLAEIVFRARNGLPVLTSFDQIKSETQSRITYRVGERYEALRQWLASRREPPDEFDHFLSRLFGEVLSQPGFGFHDDLVAAEVTANLIESVQKFRRVAGDTLAEEGVPLGREYLQMVAQGVIAAQYVRSWTEQPDDAVLIAPAFTFLMTNHPVSIQFWLDAGSPGWAERLNQPLTHPYVLSRRWPRGRPWTEYDELDAGQEVLSTLALGLLHRCRERIYLGLSKVGEQGYESSGPLLQALQRLLLAAGAG
ncbi:MAG: hypothetical protein MUE67_02505 [Anaerolineales bacterium]|nr:hypothetical protein [Anaerolineales bacterium]